MLNTALGWPAYVGVAMLSMKWLHTLAAVRHARTWTRPLPAHVSTPLQLAVLSFAGAEGDYRLPSTLAA